MANYRYSHFDDFGNVKPRPDTTQINCDPESSHLYGVPLFSSPAPQSDRTITYPDTLRSQSGGWQCDDRVYPDFRPYTAYHNDNTGLLDLYVHPLSGLIHPATASDFAAESFPSLYTACDDQYSQLRSAGASTTDTDFLQSYFKNFTVDDSRRPIPSPGLFSERPYRQQSDRNPTELRNSNSKILYVNSPNTGELKIYQVLSPAKQQPQQVAPNPERTGNIGRFSDGSDPPPMLRGFLPAFSVPHLPMHDMDTRALYESRADVAFRSEVDMERASTLTLPGYFDCFGHGEYYSNYNNCSKNVYHEDERKKAIKVNLDKYPDAFQPKTGDVKPRHTKGCNCKKTECLKNYCKCYEANILCSTMCKCIACKNYEESPDQEYLRNKQQYASTESILRICSSTEVVRATCACLLAQAETAEREQYSATSAEKMIIEEFGRCLEEILQKHPD